jgi:hypothetical protein
MLSHHCEHLLVYDRDGNPVKHYTLDIPHFSMKYDNEKKQFMELDIIPRVFL